MSRPVTLAEVEQGRHFGNHAPQAREARRRRLEERLAVASQRIGPATTKSTYDGAELRPYVGRPGAMDAFALPSRMGKRLHYPDGTLKEA